MMQAVVLRSLGGPNRLQLEEVDLPEPAVTEARVRLRAAALNHRDVWIRKGLYAKIRLPVVLGSDGAGVVDAVGADVDPDWVGEEVLVDPSIGWGDNTRVQDPKSYEILGMPRDGTYAQYLCVPATQLHRKPDELSWEEAAALPLAGQTAWRSVVTQGEVAPGTRVLVTGAGGGVATFAVLWALGHGAEVWVTSSSSSKIEAMEELGAAGGVRYTEAEWPQRLQEEAGGDFDLIVDGAGGDGLCDLVDVAAYGGRIVIYGATQGNLNRELDLRRIFWRQLRVQGSTMGNAEDFAAMLTFVERQKSRPIIDSVLPLAQAEVAHARMEAADQLGKVVLSIP